jgi:hypothetical protein
MLCSNLPAMSERTIRDPEIFLYNLPFPEVPVAVTNGPKRNDGFLESSFLISQRR